MNEMRAGPGRIEKTLIRWLMRPATVTAVEPLSARFRLIDLAGDALQGVVWRPGQKIQVMLGGLFTARTYTPMEWDARGSTRILAWSHGAGPGSDWATGLAEGDECQFFGPRRSLDVADIEGPLVLFGDETSFGLAAALTGMSGRTPPPQLLFEVSDAGECGPVLQATALGAATLVERRADSSHMPDLESRITQLAQGDATFVLTGRAQAIQRLNRALRMAGVGSTRLRSKAYWAPGKAGLD
ncbi:siderophore-interacting protein [Sphingomonas sp. dw_22]|uniref:siderophore-interacting protein n=1 Tax=Sphingomonas sp. dw_22 TaxID=2721175 RepID=UPI001BD2A42F|nr:siderophore-interacting protein [Sphingomonas sp. dw_22]